MLTALDMKRLVCFLVFAGWAAWASAQTATWLTDYPAAQAQAARENKFVFLDFTGSDWCGWCKRLKAEVFDHPEFAAYAASNLVLVEVDFPRHKSQPAGQKEANQKLAEKYGIPGFPTVILLDGTGQRVGQLGYQPGGVSVFVETMDRLLADARRNEAIADKAAAAPKKPVEFVPIPPTPPTHYDQLALKGISGPANRRLAMINNVTLSVGETGSVRIKDGLVNVCCNEIHDDSVLVTVEGKQVELRFPGR